jgi:hypothetical protein
LDSSLSAKTIAASIPKLYLGKNTVVADSNNGFQTTLPVTTTNLMYSSGYRITSGSTYDYFNSDKFKIDSSGTITSSSSGTNTFAGALSSASFSTTGALSANSASVTGLLSSGSINSGSITSSATITANNLKITSTNLEIDSVNGKFIINSNASGSNAFKLNTTSGVIQTYGDISTTGTGTITSAGAISGAALNVGTGFKVDSYGALVVKDSTDITKTIYSFDKSGNFSTSGSLTASGTATLASGKFIVDGASGNLTSSGNLNTSGVVNIGTADSPSIQLSNNGTSYFKNSLQIGDASSQKTILNADGTASFASGNFSVGASGDVVAKGRATFGINNEIAVGHATGSSTLTNAKLSVDANGNVAAAGTLNIAGNSTLTGTLSVATNNLTVNANGDLTTKGVLSVSDGKLTANASGDLTTKGVLSVSDGKLTVNANGNVDAKGTMAVAGATTLSSTLAVTGNSTFLGNLSVVGTSSLSNGYFTVDPTGYMTTQNGANLANGKFIIDVNGNIVSKGSAVFANNQIAFNTDGSASFGSKTTSNFAYSSYVPANSLTDYNTDMSTMPAENTPAYTALFASSTNNVLTTQEYVNKAIFKQTLRLNTFLGPKANETFETLEKYNEVLAKIDGTTAAGIISGLQGDYSQIYQNVSLLTNSSYNSILMNCVPGIWVDECPPQPIPTPITNYFTEDGWFFSNLAVNNKINWYLPVNSQMNIGSILNLFINIFAVSTKSLPSITLYTAPKNNTSDLYSGVANAKITYYFAAPSPNSNTALDYYLMYTSNQHNNVYNTNKLQTASSITRNASNSVTTTISAGTTFGNSYDKTIVNSSDIITNFVIETTGLENVKDVMFILQSFCVTTSNGTTQMLFKNADVVNNYLMNYFFKTNTDFSSYVQHPESYFNEFTSGIQNNNLITLSEPESKPDALDMEFSVFRINGTAITSNNQIITLPLNTSSSSQIPIVVQSDNLNNSIQISCNSVSIANKIGIHSGNITGLIVGDNSVVVKMINATDNTKTVSFTTILRVKSSVASIQTIAVNNSTTYNGNPIVDDSKINLSSGTNSATVTVTPTNNKATYSVVFGGVVQTTTTISGLAVGDNLITINCTSEDETNSSTTEINLYVLSADTSLRVFSIAGHPVTNGSSINLGSAYFGKSLSELSIIATPNNNYATVGEKTIVGLGTLVYGNNTVTFNVTAENNLTILPFNVNIFVQSSDGSLSSLSLNLVSKQVASGQTFTFASNVTQVDIVAVPTSSQASVAISGSTTGLTPGSSRPITVTVTSGEGTIETYSYTLYVQSNNDKIGEGTGSIYVNGTKLTISDYKASITLRNLNPVSNITLTVTADDIKSTMSYILNDASVPVTLDDGVQVTVNSIIINNNILKITNIAEDPLYQKEYEITIINVSNDTTLSLFNATYNGTTEALSDGKNVTLPRGVNQVTVSALATNLLATAQFDFALPNSPGNTSTGSTTVLSGSTVTVLLEVTAQDGTTKQNYSVSFSAPALSTDATLSALSYRPSGSNSIPLDVANISQSITLNNGVTSFSVNATASNQYAKSVVATANGNSVALNSSISITSGTTITILISVTAENNNKKEYTIAISAPVSQSDTSLSSFTVNNEAVTSGSTIYLPSGTNSATVLAIPTASQATVVIVNNTNLVKGLNIVYVTVSRTNGSFRQYNVNLIVAPPSTETTLLNSLTFSYKNSANPSGTAVNLDIAKLSQVVEFLNNVTDLSLTVSPVNINYTVEMTYSTVYPEPDVIHLTNSSYLSLSELNSVYIGYSIKDQDETIISANNYIRFIRRP